MLYGLRSDQASQCFGVTPFKKLFALNRGFIASLRWFNLLCSRSRIYFTLFGCSHRPIPC